MFTLAPKASAAETTRRSRVHIAPSDLVERFGSPLPGSGDRKVSGSYTTVESGHCCEHHYVFGLPRERAPTLIVAILPERMDLMARLADRLLGTLVCEYRRTQLDMRELVAPSRGSGRLYMCMVFSTSYGNLYNTFRVPQCLYKVLGENCTGILRRLLNFSHGEQILAISACNKS